MKEAKGSGCREDETVVGRNLHGADTLQDRSDRPLSSKEAAVSGGSAMDACHMSSTYGGGCVWHRGSPSSNLQCRRVYNVISWDRWNPGVDTEEVRLTPGPRLTSVNQIRDTVEAEQSTRDEALATVQLCTPAICQVPYGGG